VLDFKVTYSQNYKGFQRDAYPSLKARVEADMALALSKLNLLFWAGEVRYQQMLGLTPETVGPWRFRWYEYLDAHIYNQVRAVLWMLDPEHMAEEEAWDL
jgi:hypothetical protein